MRELSFFFHVTWSNLTFISCDGWPCACNRDENRIRWKTTTFEQTPIMSTYLLAFAVAEFRNITESSENSTIFTVYSSRDALASMKFALDFGRSALKALEDYIGLDYQLSKMDFIAIDDFLMGAMENWGLVSFKWVFECDFTPPHPLCCRSYHFFSAMCVANASTTDESSSLKLIFFAKSNRNFQQQQSDEGEKSTQKMKSNEKLMIWELKSNSNL